MTIGKFKLKVGVPSLLGCPGKAFYKVTEEDWVLSIKYLSSLQEYSLSSLQDDCEIYSVHPVALYHIGMYLLSDSLINFALHISTPNDTPYFLKHISDPEHRAILLMTSHLKLNLLFFNIWTSASPRAVASLAAPGGQESSLFLKFWSIFLNFSSNITFFFPHFGPPGGWVAHPGRLWLHHWCHHQDACFSMSSHPFIMCLKYL